MSFTYSAGPPQLLYGSTFIATGSSTGTGYGTLFQPAAGTTFLVTFVTAQGSSSADPTTVAVYDGTTQYPILQATTTSVQIFQEMTMLINHANYLQISAGQAGQTVTAYVTGFQVMLPSSGSSSPYVTSLNGLTGAITATTPNSTLTIGTSGQHVTFDINLANGNSWTGAQSFGAITTTAGSAIGVTSKSSGSPYTVLSTDEFILVTTGAGGYTVTLPAANANAGRKLIIIKADNGAGAVTINRAGADTIEGATSKTLTIQYNKIGLISDGTSVWYDIGTGGGI